MAEWFERPAFWEVMSPWMFDAERLDGTPSEVDGIVLRLRVEPPAHILDLCCGPGRHAAELHRRGFHVTGVDLHSPYLDRARAAAPQVEWSRADMREFVRPGAFAAALLFYGSFGYFADPDDDRRVAQNIFDSLEPGGALLLDTHGKEILARRYEPRRWHEGEDGAILLERVEVEGAWEAVRTTWTHLDGSARSDHQFWNRLYSGVELRSLLRQVGFAEVDLYGALDGRAYGPAARRLIAVARKP